MEINYYGYYPRYWRPIAVISIGIYRHNHWHRHAHYHGGRGHTSVNINVNNRNTYNNYNNNTRKTSNTVNNNINKGNFNTAGKGGERPSTSKPSSKGVPTKQSSSHAGRTKNSNASN